MHPVHVRFVGGLSPTASLELSGYVHPGSDNRHIRFDGYRFFSGTSLILLKSNGYVRGVTTTMPFFGPGITTPHRIAWCQTWPWEARQAALIFLVCGKRRLLHKDVARLLAMAIYSTRNKEEWCVMIEGFSLLMGRFMK